MKKYFCRCCKSNDLLLYLDLGNQPLANQYHKNEKLLQYPLEVMLCKRCFHNQLSVVIDPDLMFTHYLYVSGTTATFRSHTKALAQDAVKRFKKKKLQVLDIACNDGTQLEDFRELDCDIMGVDPAQNLRPLTKKKQIPVIVDYWTRRTAKKIAKKFDIMTGTNVFAHVDDVDEFLHACKLSLAPSGLIILEFPYADNMIANNEFDTVYHEHVSYFLVNSFKTLIERVGLHIVDIVKTQIHGGSIRFFLQNGIKKHTEKINEFIKSEKTRGLLTVSTYVQYANRVKQNRREMRRIIKELRDQKRKVVGYGASAKGNTMLNYFKIVLDYIVDDNPFKWGYTTPGRNILIKRPLALQQETDELYVVILAWNFYNEIARKILSIRGEKRNDYALLYVPFIEKRSLIDKKEYLPSA